MLKKVGKWCDFRKKQRLSNLFYRIRIIMSEKGTEPQSETIV